MDHIHGLQTSTLGYRQFEETDVLIFGAHFFDLLCFAIQASTRQFYNEISSMISLYLPALNAGYKWFRRIPGRSDADSLHRAKAACSDRIRTSEIHS